MLRLVNRRKLFSGPEHMDQIQGECKEKPFLTQPGTINWNAQPEDVVEPEWGRGWWVGVI